MTSRPLFLLLFVAILAGGVAAAHLIPGIDGSEIERNIRDSLHVIGFAGVAWILFEMLPAGRLGKAVGALFGAIALGFLAESAQRWAGFTFSQADLVRDAVGAGLMVLARLLWAAPASRLLQVITRGLAAIAVIGVFVPFGYWGWGLLGERLKAPVLGDFDGHYAAHYFETTHADVILDRSAENGFLDIKLTRAPRSGVRIFPALYDWRRYEWLVFDAEIVTGRDSVVSVHLNDYDSIGHYVDAQSGMVTVTGAATSHRVPLQAVLAEAGRADDLGNIRQVALFARSQNRGTLLRIDNLRLE